MSVNAWAHLTLTERSQFCLFALLVRSSVFVIEVRRLKSHLPHLKDYTFQFWPHYQLLRRERKFTSRCSRSLFFSVIHAYLLFWKHVCHFYTMSSHWVAETINIKGMPSAGADKLGFLHAVRCIELPLAAFASFICYFSQQGWVACLSLLERAD